MLLLITASGIEMRKCPLCNHISPLSKFKTAEIRCMGCKSHAALKCPNCNELIDLVYNNMEEVK